MYLKCYIDCTFRLQILKTFEYLHLYLLSLPCTLPRLSFPLIILTIYIIYFLWFRKIYHIDFFQIYENILIHVPPSLSLSLIIFTIYIIYIQYFRMNKKICATPFYRKCKTRMILMWLEEKSLTICFNVPNLRRAKLIKRVLF